MTFGAGNEQEFIRKITQLTLDNLENEHFGGRELAIAMGMSWPTLNRKVQGIMRKRISQLIREIRLQKAMELLQQNNITASEAAFKVGFDSPAYFNKSFKEFFGFPPGEVKKKMEDGTLPLPGKSQATDVTLSETPSHSFLSRFTKPYRIVAILGLALLILALGIVFLAQKGNLIYLPGGQDKSIAVLPFKNLSSEADNQYFADGINEDILNHLFRISDLRVISRTTAERFRESELSTTEIAKSMGVRYILEGSVRKQGDRVRITVQLIDGKNDRHLWAENYDRQLADIFFIQSDIAQSVARELRALLSPKETESIERPLTQNIRAYDFYLRGKDFLNRGHDEEDFRFAIQMFEEAVEIDPNFALAWVGLSASSRGLKWWYYDQSQENISRIKQYLDKALALAPQLKEVRMEEALFYYICERDYLKSLELLKKIEKEYPNDEAILANTSFVYRRIGKFEKSLEYINLAISLNPSEWYNWYDASITYHVLKDFKNAEYYNQEAIQLNPSFPVHYLLLFDLYLKTGQIRKAEDFIVLHKKRFGSFYFLMQARMEFLTRKLSNAIQSALQIPGEDFLFQSFALSKNLELGLIYHCSNNPSKAKEHFSFARNYFLEKLKDSENDWRLYSCLSIACAGLGLREEALEAIAKAEKLQNLKIDGFAGLDPQPNLITALILLHEYEEALLRLDQVVGYSGYLITVEHLKLHPVWDPVRGHQKFKEIINNPAYQIRL
ncbi:MAG: helix-turn-helix domain-containing protein [Bacteroidales bacterium]